MIRILLLTMLFLVACDETRPCDIEYKYWDEKKDQFIELKAKNIHDCKPYEHLPIRRKK